MTTLGQHIRTQKGYAFKSGWYCDEGRPIVKVSDFTDDSIESSGLVRIPEGIADGYMKYELRLGDVVIQTVGSWPNNPKSVVGKAVRVPGDVAGALLNQNAVKVEPTKELDRGFLYYLLRSERFKSYIVGTAQGAASQAAITLDSIRAFSFELPRLDTQKRAAETLSAYDDLIENNARRIKILEEIAQTLYREWFVHFRFPGHEKVKLLDNTIPQGWEVLRIADFGQVITGKTPSKAVAEYFGKGTPFIKIPDMHGEMFCLQTMEELTEPGAQSQTKKTLPEDSICVSCIGTAGLVSMTTRPSQTNQQINSIVPKERDDREFLYYAAIGLSDKIQGYGATGATMANLSKGKFESLEILTPPKFMRTKFHEITAPSFDLIKVLGRANINLRRTRNLLLPKLVSGEIPIANNQP